jgi:hypothetical protein
VKDGIVLMKQCNSELKYYVYCCLFVDEHVDDDRFE